jgi:hypothetical protein
VVRLTARIRVKRVGCESSKLRVMDDYFIGIVGGRKSSKDE